MTREQALNYMRSSGWSEEQINTVTEALTCEDAISRQAAIDAIWDGVNMDIYTREVKECLEQLPSVSTEKTGRWIPVSERLPEAGKQYLCCDVNGFREVGYLSKTLGEWGFLDSEAVDEVIAWMPLPQPYKSESEGKE